MTKEKDHEVKVKRIARGFTMVQNSFIEDETLSLKAKGLFVYFLSKPDAWKLNIKGDVVKRSRDGVDSVYSGIRELIEAGYVSRTKKYNGEITYHLFENKSDNDIADYTLKPDPENPDLGNPNQENPDLGNPNVLVIPKDSNTESSNTDVSKVGKTPPAKPEESQPSIAEENSKPFIINRLIEHGVDKRLADEYWYFRATIKKNRLTNRAITLLINECATHSFSISEGIKLQIANGWMGFKVEYARNLQQKKSSQRPQQMSKREAVEAHNAKIAEELKAQLRGIDYEH